MDNAKNATPINVEDIIATACKLPYCKIERDAFLTTQLKGKVSEKQLADALENGTINAGISIDLLNKIASGTIK
ncbi:MAG: hypothetical protein LUG92_07415, partial [Oscillospiraceae bacterium]|nr:hypothetical protein [Oscillospiraceae bacterium]